MTRGQILAVCSALVFSVHWGWTMGHTVSQAEADSAPTPPPAVTPALKGPMPENQTLPISTTTIHYSTSASVHE